MKLKKCKQKSATDRRTCPLNHRNHRLINRHALSRGIHAHTTTDSSTDMLSAEAYMHTRPPTHQHTCSQSTSHQMIICYSLYVHYFLRMYANQASDNIFMVAMGNQQNTNLLVCLEIHNCPNGWLVGCVLRPIDSEVIQRGNPHLLSLAKDMKLG